MSDVPPRELPAPVIHYRGTVTLTREVELFAASDADAERLIAAMVNDSTSDEWSVSDFQVRVTPLVVQ
jgi:hypothetical protein